MLILLLISALHSQSILPQEISSFLAIYSNFTRVVNLTRATAPNGTFLEFAPPSTFFVPTNNAFANSSISLSSVSPFQLRYQLVNQDLRNNFTKSFVYATSGHVIQVNREDGLVSSVKSGLNKTTTVSNTFSNANGSIQLLAVDSFFTKPTSILNTAQQLNFTGFASLVKDLGFESHLNNLTNVTFCLVSNDRLDSFQRTHQDILESKNANVSKSVVLESMIIQGIHYSTNFTTRQSFPSAFIGSLVNITTSQDSFQISTKNSTVNVVDRDILINGGLMHVCDDVLIPDAPFEDYNVTLPSFIWIPRMQSNVSVKSQNSGKTREIGMIGMLGLMLALV